MQANWDRIVNRYGYGFLCDNFVYEIIKPVSAFSLEKLVLM